MTNRLCTTEKGRALHVLLKYAQSGRIEEFQISHMNHELTIPKQTGAYLTLQVEQTSI